MGGRAPLDQAQHLATARHHEELAEVLILDVIPSRPQMFDWALIAIFYAAMHYAAAALIRDTGSAPEQHASSYKGGVRVQGMADAVSENYGTGVAPAYHNLSNLGWEARYRALYLTQTNWVDAIEVLRDAQTKLEIVKQAQSILPPPAAVRRLDLPRNCP